MNPCSKCGRNAGVRKTGKARKLCDSCLQAHRVRFSRREVPKSEEDWILPGLERPEAPPMKTQEEIDRELAVEAAYRDIDEWGRPIERTVIKPAPVFPPLPPDAGIPADYPRGHPLSKAAPRIVWEFVVEEDGT